MQSLMLGWIFFFFYRIPDSELCLAASFLPSEHKIVLTVEVSEECKISQGQREHCMFWTCEKADHVRSVLLEVFFFPLNL